MWTQLLGADGLNSIGPEAKQTPPEHFVEQSTPEATAAIAADTSPVVTFDVVRHRGHWRILHIGKHSSPHESQKSAIDCAVKLALSSQSAGYTVAVRLNRTDGQVFDLTDRLAAS